MVFLLLQHPLLLQQLLPLVVAGLAQVQQQEQHVLLVHMLILWLLLPCLLLNLQP